MGMGMRTIIKQKQAYLFSKCIPSCLNLDCLRYCYSNMVCKFSICTLFPRQNWRYLIASRLFVLEIIMTFSIKLVGHMRNEHLIKAHEPKHVGQVRMSYFQTHWLRKNGYGLQGVKTRILYGFYHTSPKFTPVAITNYFNPV